MCISYTIHVNMFNITILCHETDDNEFELSIREPIFLLCQLYYEIKIADIYKFA